MNCLVTGAAGFIGSHLCERLLQDGHTVKGIDSFSDYYDRSLKEGNVAALKNHSRFSLVEADLLETDLDALMEGMEAIFHHAAQAGVRSSWGKEFHIYVESNIRATQALLEACRYRELSRFVYASSSSVYGDTRDLPMREDSNPQPVSPYGVSKLAAEHLCYLYHKNFSVPTVSLRYFTVYGARQRPDMAFHRFIKWALTGHPLQLYGDGGQSRDFTHVSDIVEANCLALYAPVVGEVLNIGGGARFTMCELLELLEKIMGKRLSVERHAVQKGDMRHTGADMTKAHRLLGYRPRVPLREGIVDEYEWLRRLHCGPRESNRAPGSLP